MSAALSADELVAETKQRLIEYFDTWVDVDETVFADFASAVDDFQAAVELAAGTRLVGRALSP